MSLKRNMESPLLSEDDVLRRASLLQLVNRPSLEGAKAIINALLHFLEERPEIAEEFEHVLYTPPLGRLAEQPVLGLLENANPLVREEAAYILYRLGISTASRDRLLHALQGDASPWVRAYAAKALGLLQGASVGAALAEAIDNEAMLDIIVRMGEALALTGDRAMAEVLREQAEQLRERQAPPDTAKDPWLQTAAATALFFEALAARLEGSAEELAPSLFQLDGESGPILVAGGREDLGFAARAERSGELLKLDSQSALDRLQSRLASEG